MTMHVQKTVHLNLLASVQYCWYCQLGILNDGLVETCTLKQSSFLYLHCVQSGLGRAVAKARRASKRRRTVRMLDFIVGIDDVGLVVIGLAWSRMSRL